MEKIRALSNDFDERFNTLTILTETAKSTAPGVPTETAPRALPASGFDERAKKPRRARLAHALRCGGGGAHQATDVRLSFVGPSDARNCQDPPAGSWSAPVCALSASAVDLRLLA